MASQTREHIAEKLIAHRGPVVDPYQYLLLELILDVLVDIRDRLDDGDKDLPPST